MPNSIRNRLVARGTEKILEFAVPNYQDVNVTEVRARYGFLEAWVSIVGNIALFIVKLTLGIFIHSISLIADAFHTLSDVVTSVVVLVGFKISRKEADKEHPFGHGRVENVATLVIAILLILVGLQFLKSSIDRFISPETVKWSRVALGAMIISAVIKEAMAGFSIDLGKRIQSSALIADAWHHRSDAVASVFVAVAVLAARFGYPGVDAIFGILVSLLIIYTGYELATSSGNYLIGVGPAESLVREIVGEAEAVSGVDGIHEVVVHDYGDRKAISLHIEVEGGIDLARAHEIASEVEMRISDKMKASATVHVEPANKFPEEGS